MPFILIETIHTPKPWYVATYSIHAARSVLMSDYGAKKMSTSRFRLLDGSEIKAIVDTIGMDVTKGTYFILPPLKTERFPTYERLMDSLHHRSARLKMLFTHRDVRRWDREAIKDMEWFITRGNHDDENAHDDDKSCTYCGSPYDTVKLGREGHVCPPCRDVGK